MKTQTPQTRVLLAEDDRQLRAYMNEALHFLGFLVTVATDGAEALARCAQHPFDIVLTDHNMPRLGGVELVRALRERGFTGRIYVVSGLLSEAEHEDYEGLGVDGMAEKPLRLTELNALLRSGAHIVAA